jgi:predicted ATPase/class 3 adenylate cyclase
MRGTAVDIAAWLSELGLERYAEAFRDNDIDARILHTLSADDLKDLGVSSLGHRKTLLDAIARLRDAERTVGTGNSGAARPTSGAERRQLTVLFCDLVGSTELSARLDPEDMGALIRTYQECCAAGVKHWEGHVAKYMGDGVLAYFGYPRAHEDDAERAVRAGLALIDAVGRMTVPSGETLAARVGIATGLVMVGDLVGEGPAQEQTVVGETPNLAARLQALAEPGTVVISQTTRRLLGGLFELTDLGLQRLRGFAEPLSAWRVEGEGRAEGRFEARQTAGLTRLIGREEELALLLRRWRHAADGEGQVVLLSGEPGIGKSRLVRELRERLESEAHLRLLYQCSPHHTTSPLHPVIEHLERASGFERDDSPEVRLAKLEALLARGTDKLDEAVALVSALFGIMGGKGYPVSDMTPQRQKQRTLEVLVEHLEGLSAKEPVLLIYEDVHWIDPTTQELLGFAIEHVQHLSVLATIAFRPEFQPPWAGLPHVSAVTLTRLGRRDGTVMVGQVVGDKALPDEVAAQIVAKTDGVPLFVEELTKSVLESGLLQEADDRYELSGPLPPLAIPSTLHDSLLARLDRLAPVKEVAQIGAAIGREFSHALLAAVADRPDADLRTALDQLVSSELVFRRGVPPDATYSFKHALVQDAAYGTLLKSRRQHLHARIAVVLEEQFPETARSQPELLAHHCTHAGLVEKAIDYWHKAGQLAIGRSAMKEAIAQLISGLDLVPCLAGGRVRARRELDLQLTLAGALLVAKGWAAPEAGSAYARARELCRKVGEIPQLITALTGLRNFHGNCARVNEALEFAKELLDLGTRHSDSEAKYHGHHGVGLKLLFRGEFEAGRIHLEEAMLLYDPAKHRLPLGVNDPGVSCQTFIGWILQYQGHLDRALTLVEEAFARAQALRYPYTLAFAMHVNCVFYQVRRDRARVEERSAALQAIAAEQGFAHFMGTGAFFHSWAEAAAGDVADGIARMRNGLAAKRATGAELKVPYYLGLLATACARIGQSAEALSLIDDALDRVAKTGERWFEAELHRRKGEVLLSLRERRQAAAETSFRLALAVAQDQRAKLWELRAAMSLARLWRDQGKRARARDLLAPIYGWFTEGFDTADLRDAKALLDGLA